MDISVIVPFYKGNQYMEQLFGVIRRNAQSAPALQIELVLVNDSPQCPIVYNPAWVEGFSLQVSPVLIPSSVEAARTSKETFSFSSTPSFSTKMMSPS